MICSSKESWIKIQDVDVFTFLQGWYFYIGLILVNFCQTSAKIEQNKNIAFAVMKSLGYVNNPFIIYRKSIFRNKVIMYIKEKCVTVSTELMKKLFFLNRPLHTNIIIIFSIKILEEEEL